MPGRNYLFTSESVSEGHPDKMCDQISDAILDAYLAGDPDSRVACETLVKTGLVLCAGEITSKTTIDHNTIIRQVVNEIGFDHSDTGFDGNTCSVQLALVPQSPDISQGVTAGDGLHKEQGAGDQGMMFGYACDETPVFMPISIHYSHRLVEYMAERRKAGDAPWMRADSKSQVTVEYVDDKPTRIACVVISTQHAEDVSWQEINDFIVEEIIRKVIPAELMDDSTTFHVNPTGKFVQGGPYADAGLTGRKIIVDTYGGHGAHGGGAFSGKDPSKVDRSAAYQEPGGRGRLREVPGPAGLRHRRRRARLGHGRHLRHRQVLRREARRVRARDLPHQARRHHRPAPAQAPHLPPDRGLRALRA